MKGLKSKLNKSDIKKFANLFVSRTKVFLLAGLLGGMTACEDVLEPEIKQQNTMPITETKGNAPDNYSEITNDSFMGHMSDLGATTFYNGQYANFTPSVNGGYVDGLFFTDYGHNTPHAWYYGSGNVQVLNRTDAGSTDGTASFGVDNYNFLVRDDATWKTWQIQNVPADEYSYVFGSMTPAVLAQRARDSLTVAGAAAGYTNTIYNAISSGDGTWTLDNGQMKFISKGTKVPLQYSDFGLKQGPTKVVGAIEPDKYETSSYIGGMSANRTDAPSTPMRFFGTAVVSVMPINDYDYAGARGGLVGTDLRTFTTDSLAATYSYGINADTLTMRFNGWYDLVLIREHGSEQIALGFGAYPAVSDFMTGKTKWSGNENTFVNAPINKAPNGIDFSSYVSESENYSVYVNVSEPLFYGEKTDITTGLDNVYCGAPRRAKASDDSTLPQEVVMSGDYKEYSANNVGGEVLVTGVEISFAFGGRQR